MKKKLIAVMAIVMTMSLITCTACKKKQKKANPNVKVGEDYFPEVIFSTKDMDGNPIDETIFAEHKLTMINFWEPWCGPCVSEMADLEKLYKNYKDQGFYIIGIYSSTDEKSEVKKIMAQAGTTYPIATYDDAFARFQSGAVPTSIFVDENGWVLPLSAQDADKLFVGAGTYEQWEALIKTYLDYEEPQYGEETLISEKLQ